MTTDDLVVRGGTLVGAEGPTAADLAVADGDRRHSPRP
jgi:hypothetical protein